MTKETVIEDLRSMGMSAVVIDEMHLFSTYKDFANKARYPEAICVLFAGVPKKKSLKSRLTHTFKVLARGNHGYPGWEGVIIYVIESEDGERFLVGEKGLEITETKPKYTPFNLSKMPYTELIRYADEVQSALRRKMYAEGFEEGRKAGRNDGLRTAKEFRDSFDAVTHVLAGSKRTKPKKTPQQRRDEIVERAKADINGLKSKECIYGGSYYRTPYVCYADFVINKEKRTVVVLMRCHISGKIYARGIAKCAPGDCFNASIGRAIALRRALGVTVPSDYLVAPQPTEVRVGDVVQGVRFRNITMTITSRDESKDTDEYGEAFRHTRDKGWIGERQVRVIDDSREEDE